MRFLHTSDWHLGRSFHGASLLEEQAAALARAAELREAQARLGAEAEALRTALAKAEQEVNVPVVVLSWLVS